MMKFAPYNRMNQPQISVDETMEIVRNFRETPELKFILSDYICNLKLEGIQSLPSPSK